MNPASIEMFMAKCDGIWLKSIKFNKEGWVQTATFDGDLILINNPYSWADTDTISNYIVKTKPAPTPPNKFVQENRSR